LHLTLNAISNCIRKPTRAEWIAHTDFVLIEMIGGDLLPRYAVRRPGEATAGVDEQLQGRHGLSPP
jgi:hypothetical protein